MDFHDRNRAMSQKNRTGVIRTINSIEAAPVTNLKTCTSLQKFDYHQEKRQKFNKLDKRFLKANTENSKEFVEQSRDILRKEISIKDKTEERQKLVEFIVMEEEKLYDAKMAFNEDCKKFNEYLENVQLKANEMEGHRRRATRQNDNRTDSINGLTAAMTRIQFTL
jgi:hypothetical protein